VFVQAEHPKTGAGRRKSGWLAVVEVLEQKLGYCGIFGEKYVELKNADKQQDTVTVERARGTTISVMRSSGHNTSHLCSCSQEACFFHQNTL